MNDWLRGIVHWMGLSARSAADGGYVDPEKEEVRGRLDRIEARIDILDLVVANLRRWPHGRRDEHTQRD